MPKRPLKDLSMVLFVLAAILAPLAEGREHGRNSRPQRGALENDSGELRAAEAFSGMRVEDLQGKKIGEVNGLIIDPLAGRMAYVVVSTGVDGGDQVIVPWSALQMQQRPRQDRPPGTPQRSDRVLVLHVPQEELRRAPRVGGDALPDREEGVRIHRFYGVSPYWEEGEQRP